MIIQLNQINFQKLVHVRVILITSFDQFNPIYPRAYSSSWCIELCSTILLYNFEHVVTTIWDQNTNMDGSVKPLELNTTFDSYE